MSNSVFPILPGAEWKYKRTVLAPKVKVLTTPSEREFRARDSTAVRYRYTFSYEFLRQAAAYAEWQTLEDLFKAHGGDFDSFLLTDPDDNSVAAMMFGTGDGATSQFQLLRALGSFLEPIYEPDGAPQVFLNAGWQGAQLQYTTARTNLSLRAEEMGDAYWTKTGQSAVSTNTMTAPDGTATADVFVEDSINSGKGLTRSMTITAGQTVCVSRFFKASGSGSQRWVRLQVSSDGGTNAFRAWFDINAGAVTSFGQAGTGVLLAYGIAPVSGAPGWFRAWVAGQVDPAATSVVFAAYPASASAGGLTYTGDGVSGFASWGAMFEVGTAVPTSYIKTTSATVTVTDYSHNGSGGLTFTTAPPVGAVLSWTGSYYRRARFLHGELDFEKLWQDFWQAKKVDLISVKPGSQ